NRSWWSCVLCAPRSRCCAANARLWKARGATRTGAGRGPRFSRPEHTRTTRTTRSDRLSANAPFPRSEENQGRAATAAPLNRSKEGEALWEHRALRATTHIRTLFAEDPDRAAKYVLEVGDLHVDYSKNLVTDRTLELLIDLARATRVTELRD